MRASRRRSRVRTEYIQLPPCESEGPASAPAPVVGCYPPARAVAWASSELAWWIQTFACCSVSACPSNAAALSAALISAASAARCELRLSIELSSEVQRGPAAVDALIGPRVTAAG